MQNKNVIVLSERSNNEWLISQPNMLIINCEKKKVIDEKDKKSKW